MGRKRIDFRDAGHRRDKGRADGATRTNHVAAIVGPSHEFGRNPVDDGISVVDDTFQLRLKPFANLRREADPPYLCFAVSNTRSVSILSARGCSADRACPLSADRGVDHIVYLPRVVDDDFLGKLVVSQEAEALDHFVRRPKCWSGLGMGF